MKPPPVAYPGHRVRVGCDLVELAEVDHSLRAFGQRYLRRLFTEGELAACTGATRIARLAARVAAKEAAIKAFALPEAPFTPTEIEVVTTSSLPSLRLRGAAARLAAEQGWTEVSLSLTHADCHAAAVVVAICADADGR